MPYSGGVLAYQAVKAGLRGMGLWRRGYGGDGRGFCWYTGRTKQTRGGWGGNFKSEAG